MNLSGGHLSKEFFELVKAIGESRSKQEEDRIIQAEILTLKQRLTDPQISPSKMREYLVRSLYVEMLGHDASFAHIHGVKSAQSKDLLCKRTGYLACCLCLDRQHELLLLLINTIQKDLSSSNTLEVAAALGAVSKLLNEEMAPAILPQILSLIVGSPNVLIRKKCCVALHAMYQLNPQTLLAEGGGIIRRALCDPDPSVMAASLNILHEVAKENPDGWKDLVPSLVSILKQVIEHRLPREYDYHRIPAPWIQVKLLSLLATLGEGDQSSSEQMQEILVDVLRKAEYGANVGFAIIYECVRTITTIYPSSRLLDLAANSISRLISSDNHNLKYVGVTGLASIVRVHPTFAAQPEHQLIVLDCLEDIDETLKRRTLELLYRMSNPKNAQAVVEKLLLHLRMSVDVDFRRDLVAKITMLADRFAPNHLWFLRTMSTVFELGGELVPEESAHNLLRLVAEGPTGNEEEDEEFRREVVGEFIRLAERAQFIPDILVKVSAWVLGEYGSLNSVPGYESLESLLSLLCDCLQRTFEDLTTRVWILSAICKLSVLRLLAICSPAHKTDSAAIDLMDGLDSSTSLPVPSIPSPSIPFPSSPGILWPPVQQRVTPEVASALEKFGTSELPDVSQRCREIRQLILDPVPGTEMSSRHFLRELFPFDAACEDITIDANLTFLDDFVASSLAAGARPYKSKEERKARAQAKPTQAPIAPTLREPETSQLRFAPYDPPTRPHLSTAVLQPGPDHGERDAGGERPDQEKSVFQVQGPRKWGPTGYRGMPSSTPKDRADSHDPSMGPPATAAPVRQLHAPADASETQRRPTDRELAASALFSGLAPTTVISGGPFRSQLPNAARHSDVASIASSRDATMSLASDARSAQLTGPSEPREAKSVDLLDLDSSSATGRQSSQSRKGVEDLDILQATHRGDNAIAATNDLLGVLGSAHPTPAVTSSNAADLMADALDPSITSPSVSLSIDPPAISLHPPAPNLHLLTPGPQKPPSELTSIFRPGAITTQRVELLWDTFPVELRGTVKLNGSIRTIEDVFQILRTSINLGKVEVIGLEGIGAAQSIIDATWTILHVRLDGMRRCVDLIIKAENKMLSEEVLRACSACLSS